MKDLSNQLEDFATMLWSCLFAAMPLVGLLWMSMLTVKVLIWLFRL